MVRLKATLLAFSIRTSGKGGSIAVGELLSLFDRSSNPVHRVAAIRDLVHGGVARVIDQTAGQVQHTAKSHTRNAKTFIICFEGKNLLLVEHRH